MNWAASIEQLWRSPGLPIWIVLVAAGFLGVLVLVALLRERSLSNTVLAVIAVLAIAATAIMTLRNEGGTQSADRPPATTDSSSLSHPALACLDDLAGETVLAACEKVVFGSPDAVAVAVLHTASRLGRLIAAGDVSAADKVMTPELAALRRSIERDRYGLVAYVLATKERCQPAECAAYAALTDHKLIAANMEERLYEAHVQRYAANWGSTPAAALPASALNPMAGLPASVPTGKPTNAEFPTSASIPPVSIMTTEPPPSAKPAPVAAAPATTPAAAPKAAPARAQPAAPAQATQRAAAPPPAKNPPAPPKQPPKPAPAAPVQLTPAPAAAE